MLADVRRRRLASSAPGIEIAALDWGGGGPLALLHHANGFCAAMWEPVARELCRHFRVVAMDARGHGDSSAPAVAGNYGWAHFAADARAVAGALAAEHPDGCVTLGLGHSFGGTSLLGASVAKPGLFRRLLLVDPVIPPPGAALRRPGPSALAAAARRRRAVWPSREAARAKWAGKDLFRDWQPRALDLYLAEGMRDRPDGQVELKCSPGVEAAIFEGDHAAAMWRRAGENAAPTRILWARGGNFSRAVYEEVAQRMRAAEVRDVDTGHLVPMLSPELIVREALDFCGIDDGRR